VRFIKGRELRQNTPGRTRAAGATLTTAGYDVKTSCRLFRPLPEAPHVTAVDHQTASAFTRQVLSIVEQYGGESGGWGAMIVSLQQLVEFVDDPGGLHLCRE
jgi:hypothetical protein